MAAISIATSRGLAGVKLSDFTVGTSAPGTGDFEFRYNTTDTNGANVKKKDLVLALKAIIRLLNQDPQTPAGTPFIGAPPL